MAGAKPKIALLSAPAAPPPPPADVVSGATLAAPALQSSKRKQPPPSILKQSGGASKQPKLSPAPPPGTHPLPPAWDDLRIATELIGDVVDQLVEDVAFAIHRAAKTGDLSLSELWDSDTVHRLDRQLLAGSGYGMVPGTSGSVGARIGAHGAAAFRRAALPPPAVACRHCGRSLACSRLAAHLDKCLGGDVGLHGRSSPSQISVYSPSSRQSARQRSSASSLAVAAAAQRGAIGGSPRAISVEMTAARD